MKNPSSKPYYVYTSTGAPAQYGNNFVTVKLDRDGNVEFTNAQGLVEDTGYFFVIPEGDITATVDGENFYTAHVVAAGAYGLMVTFNVGTPSTSGEISVGWGELGGIKLSDTILKVGGTILASVEPGTSGAVKGITGVSEDSYCIWSIIPKGGKEINVASDTTNVNGMSISIGASSNNTRSLAPGDYTLKVVVTVDSKYYSTEAAFKVQY
jgi:hypothetical protein